MRYIIHSKTAGTFIDSSYGGDFFSEWPASTFTKEARTFETLSDAEQYASRWTGDDEYPQDVEFLPVQTDASWATMADCVAAGTRPWRYHIERAAKDPDWANDANRPPLTWHFRGDRMGASKSNFHVIGPARSGKSLLHTKLLSEILQHRT